MRFNRPSCRFCGDDIEPHPMLAGIAPPLIIPYSVIVPQTEEAREEEFRAAMRADPPDATPRKHRILDVVLCDICRQNALAGNLKIQVDPR